MGKTCSNCKKVQDVSEFSPRHKGKPRTNSWCKACMRELRRKRFAEDPVPYQEAYKRHYKRLKQEKKTDKWSAYKKPMFVSSYYEEQ